MNKIKIALASLFCATLLAIGSQVFPAVAQQAFVAFASVFGTGPAGQTIVSNASGIPIANVAGGVLTYNTGVEVLAGGGSSSTDAAVLSGTKYVHQITGANGTLGWRFPAIATAGVCHILMNTTAGVAKIYANTGGTVNGGSVDAAFSALTGIKPIVCCSTALDTLICS